MNINKYIIKKVQKDLDNGKFYQICSNETTFKKYIEEVLAKFEKVEKQLVKKEQLRNGKNY